MTGPTTPAGYADAAAELIRELNHATRPGVGVEALTVDQMYDTVAALALLTARLPQVLTQLATHLATQADAGRVVAVDGHGHHTDPADPVAAAIEQMRVATRDAVDAARALDAVQQALASLGCH